MIFSYAINNEDGDNALRIFVYRIMKGDDVYLAAIADHLTDGTIGLEYPDTKQRIETANDPQYRYIREESVRKVLQQKRLVISRL